MRSFLPKSSRDYSIPELRTNDFTPADVTLLADIGRKMDIAKASTEGRIPSPFSRAYVFYLLLYAQGLQVNVRDDEADRVELDRGRKLMQVQARRNFRGVCATIALRKVLNLNIRLEAVDIVPGSVVSDVLMPALESAPRGKQYWNPQRFYTVQQGGEKPEVLAGLSPLTSFYPSATSPTSLTSLYWFDWRTGTWYDPTDTVLDEDGRFDIERHVRTRDKVTHLLRCWAAKAHETVDRPNALSDWGVSENDRVLLRDEFKRWLDDLGPGEVSDENLETEAPIPVPPNVPSSVKSLPFFDVACDATPEHILSDLPLHDGRLLVTREQLLDSGTRLYGREFGDWRYEPVLQRMNSKGDNLGLALGLDAHVMPIGFVFVDRLFTHHLTYLTQRSPDGNPGLNQKWTGLVIDDEYYLYPFEPQILDLISPEELVKRTRGELDRAGDYYIVTLQFGEVEVTQLYAVSGQGEHIADSVTIQPETLDLRIFPDFDLRAVEDVLPASEMIYYARVPIAPEWNFKIGAFHYDGSRRAVDIDIGQKTIIGERNVVPKPGYYSPGLALFITCDEKPSGFFIEDRGLCLLDLPRPGAAPTTWDVGVDFGTSNTCVTYRNPSDREPSLLEFPVFTTMLLRNYGYFAQYQDQNGHPVNEGASAVLDFFYRQHASDEQLNDQWYFPTQIITLQTDVQDDVRWEFENGLIFFRNISLESPTIWELIEDYPQRNTAMQHPQRFRQKQDIKWEHTKWLETFMRHLKKHVMLTAAYNNASVRSIRFSYPKAFSVNQKDLFRTTLRRVWGEVGQGNFKLVSESEAVRNHFVREASEYIIFDVGGGTSDIIAFSTGEPVLQTSFRLAGGHINKYVVESGAFRQAFLHACKRVAPTGFRNVEWKEFPTDTFLSARGSTGYKPQVIETIWLGLLELIEKEDSDGNLLTEILTLLRGDNEVTLETHCREAITGFFLSVTLLFTGLAYFAGSLLEAAATGKLESDRPTFSPQFVDLLLTGNGSKLYRMVDHWDISFHRVVKEMVRRGMLNAKSEGLEVAVEDIKFSGLYEFNGEVAPKVTVALGLLTEPADSAEQEASIPVANLAGESGFAYKAGESDFDTQLVEFYRDVNDSTQAFSAPPTAPPRLAHFLDSLNEVLPKGNNQGVSIIPKIGADWNEPLKNELYRRSTRQIKTRVMENARRMARDLRHMDRGDMEALEPLFILEVASLLDRIREKYRGS